ncbi:MAG: hypothetical protein A2075_20095 [Geobacteraceae bacterium GWC2_58_44]|nr:MAG: hypothetical protein A2075_20095 [Geobacteraceae bacterium GWC2_58_44]HBG08363.1 hypothetical protein [Geobacter sp.]
MESAVKRHPVATAGLLMLLLVPGTFGCATNAKALQESSVTQKELITPAPKEPLSTASKEQTGIGRLRGHCH